MLAACLLIGLVSQQPLVTCPIMPVEPVASAGEYDYAGLRIGFCCLGCRNSFESDPKAVVEAGRASGRVFAVSLFDPVAKLRVGADKAPSIFIDHEGVRYWFSESGHRDTFRKDRKAYVRTPEKESTYCFARRKEIGTYGKAKMYWDTKDVRFYLDCDECIRRIREDVESFARQARSVIRENHPYAVPKT